MRMGAGVQPVPRPTLFDSSRADRNAWLTNGSPPARRSQALAFRFETPEAILATISDSRSAMVSAGYPMRDELALHRDNRVHFHSHPKRQHRDSHCAPGVPSGLAKYLLHQLGGTVGNLGLVGERWRAVDEHAELHNAFDAVERAERGLDLGEQHDATAPRRLLALVQVQIFPQPS